MILVVIGALFKIMHCTYAGMTANSFLSIGLISEVIVVVLIILKIIKENKSNFLNK
ncbi:MAG: GldL-related protein [Flavobacterium sp.]|uniref:GldL-related protein n=1 Tax=Flavobacterium sp. TaxID=239 RepID=UPI003BE1E3D5